MSDLRKKFAFRLDLYLSTRKRSTTAEPSSASASEDLLATPVNHFHQIPVTSSNRQTT